MELSASQVHEILKLQTTSLRIEKYQDGGRFIAITIAEYNEHIVDLEALRKKKKEDIMDVGDWMKMIEKKLAKRDAKSGVPSGRIL